MYDTVKLDNKSEDVKHYIESSKEKAPQFKEHYEAYELEKEIEIKLKRHSDKYTIYAFSALWCPDCYRNIPVLAHIQEKSGLKSRIFGHLMRDSKNPNRRWRIPPSPIEVEEFEVIKIPSIYILDKEGNKVGEIIENPPEGMTLEAVILAIFES
jgi:thiol-disulfide isomerase/thioredoxin